MGDEEVWGAVEEEDGWGWGGGVRLFDFGKGGEGGSVEFLRLVFGGGLH